MSFALRGNLVHATAAPPIKESAGEQPQPLFAAYVRSVWLVQAANQYCARPPIESARVRL